MARPCEPRGQVGRGVPLHPAVRLLHVPGLREHRPDRLHVEAAHRVGARGAPQGQLEGVPRGAAQGLARVEPQARPPAHLPELAVAVRLLRVDQALARLGLRVLQGRGQGEVERAAERQGEAGGDDDLPLADLVELFVLRGLRLVAEAVVAQHLEPRVLEREPEPRPGVREVELAVVGGLRLARAEGPPRAQGVLGRVRLLPEAVAPGGDAAAEEDAVVRAVARPRQAEPVAAPVAGRDPGRRLRPRRRRVRAVVLLRPRALLHLVLPLEVVEARPAALRVVEDVVPDAAHRPHLDAPAPALDDHAVVARPQVQPHLLRLSRHEAPREVRRPERAVLRAPGHLDLDRATLEPPHPRELRGVRALHVHLAGQVAVEAVGLLGQRVAPLLQGGREPRAVDRVPLRRHPPRGALDHLVGDLRPHLLRDLAPRVPGQLRQQPAVLLAPVEGETEDAVVLRPEGPQLRDVAGGGADSRPS